MSVRFDRVAAEYDATRGGEERGASYAAALRAHLTGRGTILDVGVGTGVVALALAAAGEHVVGFDLTEAMAQRARDRLGPRVAVGDALAPPVRDGAVSAAYSVWVLHVVGEIAAALREVHRVLRPGGRYVTVSARDNLGMEDPISEIVAELHRRLGTTVPDAPGTVAEVATGIGFEVTFAPAPEQRFRSTPLGEADSMNARTHTTLWGLDDATWASAVQPAIDALRALPHPDRPIERVVRPTLVVLDR